MKICLVSGLFGSHSVGGAERHVELLAKSFSEKHEVLVIDACARLPALDRFHGAGVYSLAPPNIMGLMDYHRQEKTCFQLGKKALFQLFDLWNPVAFLQIKKILEKEKPDVVHVHNFLGLSFAVFSAAKHLGIPVVHTVHDYYWLCPERNLMRGRRLSDTPDFFDKLR